MANNIGYKEEKKQILDDIFKKISWKPEYSLNRRNKKDDPLTENRIMVLERIEKRRPILGLHLKFQDKLEKYFATPKQYDKFMTTCMSLPDFSFEEDLIRTKKINLFIGRDFSLGYEKSMKFFNKIKSMKDVSMHNILSNMPTKIAHPDLWFDFVMKSLDYSENECFKCLQKSNYMRVLTAPNKEKILGQILFLETKAIMQEFDGIIEEPHMLCTGLKTDDGFFRFTKDPGDVSTIGNRTMCCFRKGGAAEKLVKIALRSPIAATIEGKGGTKGRDTWFSYVWEMITHDEKNCCYDISLIFDNIEATATLSMDEFRRMIKIVKDEDIYHGMYCGDTRNDISIPSDIKDTRHKKPTTLVFFENELASYQHYDDSRNIYTMFEREHDDKDVIKKKIDIGELNRIAYIISLTKDKKELFEGHYHKSKTTSINEEYDENDYRRYEKQENSLPEIKWDKMNRNTKIEQLDLEKSYILRNNYSIFGCELYDNEGRLVYKLYTKEELENNKKNKAKKTNKEKVEEQFSKER